MGIIKGKVGGKIKKKKTLLQSGSQLRELIKSVGGISAIHAHRFYTYLQYDYHSFELRDTASYIGERAGEAAEDIIIKISLVHLAIIGD